MYRKKMCKIIHCVIFGVICKKKCVVYPQEGFFYLKYITGLLGGYKLFKTKIIIKKYVKLLKRQNLQTRPKIIIKLPKYQIENFLEKSKYFISKKELKSVL
jgi:hypothetical protein